MSETRIARAEQAVLSAAISWSVHHSPIEKPYDDSPAADRARATYSARSERNLHDAVAAMLAEIDASLAKREMTTVRDSYVVRFGEDQAKAIEDAGFSHVALDRIHADDDRGSDEFRYWFLACIGFDCISKFASNHGITVSEADARDWALTEGNLGEHEGTPPDYLSLITGHYSGWVVMS